MFKRFASTGKTAAFTLIELAIVLIIIGLLVGGVLVGQSLIRSSELHAIITEKDQYITATNTFRDKYFALPGDIPNAYAYWGPKAVAGCKFDDNSLNGGCDGDGDGKINYISPPGEHLKFWMHLAMSGMISGAYDGTDSVCGGICPSTVNVPASKFPGGYWDAFTQGLHCEADYEIGGCTGSPTDSGDIGDWLALGLAPTDVFLGHLTNLTNSEALSLDTKIDDGHAETGAMRGIAARVGPGNCNDDGTDYYSLIASGPDVQGLCNLFFSLK